MYRILSLSLLFLMAGLAVYIWANTRVFGNYRINQHKSLRGEPGIDRVSPEPSFLTKYGSNGRLRTKPKPPAAKETSEWRLLCIYDKYQNLVCWPIFI